MTINVIYSISDWCAKLYTKNNFRGQIQDVPDTLEEHFDSISCSVSSVQLNKDLNCTAFIIGTKSGETDAIELNQSSRFFDELEEVNSVQCSCCKYFLIELITDDIFMHFTTSLLISFGLQNTQNQHLKYKTLCFWFVLTGPLLKIFEF